MIKPKNSWDEQRKRITTQKYRNIFKNVKENFHILKKDMLMKIQEIYQHQIDWTMESHFATQ